MPADLGGAPGDCRRETTEPRATSPGCSARPSVSTGHAGPLSTTRPASAISTSSSPAATTSAARRPRHDRQLSRPSARRPRSCWRPYRDEAAASGLQGDGRRRRQGRAPRKHCGAVRTRICYSQAPAGRLLHAIYGGNQLKEQMVWFWLNHFSIYVRQRHGAGCSPPTTRKT